MAGKGGRVGVAGVRLEVGVNSGRSMGGVGVAGQ